MADSALRNHRPGLPNHFDRPASADSRARLDRPAHRRSPRPGVEPLCPERTGSTPKSCSRVSLGDSWHVDATPTGLSLPP